MSIYAEGHQRLHPVELDFGTLSPRVTEVGLLQGFPGKRERSYLLSFQIVRFEKAPEKTTGGWGGGGGKRKEKTKKKEDNKGISTAETAQLSSAQGTAGNLRRGQDALLGLLEQGG